MARLHEALYIAKILSIAAAIKPDAADSNRQPTTLTKHIQLVSLALLVLLADGRDKTGERIQTSSSRIGRSGKLKRLRASHY